MNSAEKVAEICSDLEPMKAFSATPDEIRGVEITALHSIAISLKRIADRLDKPEKRLAELDEFLSKDVVNIKYPGFE